MLCEQCQQLKATLDEMEESIKKHSSHLYSQEKKDVINLLYDLRMAFFFGNLMPYALLTKNLPNEKPSKVLTVNQSFLLLTGR